MALEDAHYLDAAIVTINDREEAIFVHAVEVGFWALIGLIFVLSFGFIRFIVLLRLGRFLSSCLFIDAALLFVFVAAFGCSDFTRAASFDGNEFLSVLVEGLGVLPVEMGPQILPEQ